MGGHSRDRLRAEPYIALESLPEISVCSFFPGIVAPSLTLLERKFTPLILELLPIGNRLFETVLPNLS